MLLANRKNSKQPGDNKQMVLARREFLNSGAYKPLANKLCEYIFANSEGAEARLLDIGCGEGYYSREITKYASEHNKVLSSYAIDVSKVAIAEAAKQRCEATNFAVASSFDLPLDDACVDIVVQVFAPASIDEVARVLTANGTWLVVNPAPNHLIELKQQVYDNPQPHETQHVKSDSFASIANGELEFTLTLDSIEKRHSLLAMTPFYWSISEDKKQQLLTNLTSATAHFDIQVLQRK